MKRTCLILLCLSFLACAGDPPRAPVEVRHGEDKIVSARPLGHTVTVGETLYAIAWRYGMDYRTLARANSIPRPYTIFPGQELSLKEKPARSSARTRSTPASKPAAAARPVAPAHTAVVTKPPTASVKTTTAKTTPTSGSSVKLGPVSSWGSPAKGKIVRGFSGSVHKGIDIDGRAGDPVVAAAPGRVVYAGSGIVGYGNLLIVKHNDLYLSAYGHNRRLLVKEGDGVRAGQKIAEKGSSATNTVKLHFEIRREGKPIDPKKLLPAR
jgi:lipoprotein NlpD